MDRLEWLEKEYPCDKRHGKAMTGCCGNKFPSNGKVDCRLHNHPTPWYECTECPYQERIGKSKALDNNK
jgi:hypothetical protein